MGGHAEAEAEAAPTKTPPGGRATDVTLTAWRNVCVGLAAAFARRDPRTLADRAVLALLALAALLRLVLILRGWPSLDSDEAVVGLMARHILHNGEFPDFFWGQFYLGPMQAYGAAALFAIFGASLVALRLPALLLTLGMLAGVYALGRAAYGRAVGLLALAWLALGPPYALIRQIVADGGHQEMLLLAALVLLGVWDRLRRPTPVFVPLRSAGVHRTPLHATSQALARYLLRPLRPLRFLSALPLRSLGESPRTPRSPSPAPLAPPRPTGVGAQHAAAGVGVKTLLEYTGIGAAMGLGFWADPLMLPVLIAALGALLLGRRRELLSTAGIALLIGFCIGAFPYLLFNVTSGGASFAQIARQRQLPGGQGTSFSLAALLGQLGETLAVALPVTFGSPHVCVTQGNIWDWYPPRLAASVVGTGLCQDANMLFSLGILALYAAAAVPIIQRLRAAGNAKDAKMREEREDKKSFTAEDAEDRRGGEKADAENRARFDIRNVRSLPTSRSSRSLRVLRLFSISPKGDADSAALWLRGMLLFIALFTVAAYASGTDAQLNQFTAARYFISLWLTVPLLFGVLWGWAAPAVRAATAWAGQMSVRIARREGRTPYAPTNPSMDATSYTSSTAAALSPSASSSASSASSAVPLSSSSALPSVAPVPSVVNPPSRLVRVLRVPRLPSAMSALMLVAVFALAIFEAGYTLGYSDDAARFGLPTTRTDQQLIALLDAHHITRYYSDYWTCYRIAFESDERILCAVRGQNGEAQLRLMNNRYPGYEHLLAATPYPAYIVLAGSPADANFASEAAAQELPHAGYVRAAVVGYAVYYHPS